MEIDLFWCRVSAKLCKRVFGSDLEILSYVMRIEITEGLILSAYSISKNNLTEILYPAGEYQANLTPDGKIEILNPGTSKAQFSFSQFREKLSLGEFVLLET